MKKGQGGGGRVFSCKNCGRSQHTTHPKKVFCNDTCKNMYFSRGVRRISKLEKEIQTLKKVMDVCFSILGIDTKPIYRVTDPTPKVMGMEPKRKVT